jgi:sphinganine-1-phosphate aldolase
MTEPLLDSKGIPKDDLIAKMKEIASGDADWRSGKTWSLVYFAGDEVLEVLREAYATFISCNGLSPFAFPSLRQFEHEVVSMAVELMNGGETGCGTMTSGGTESICMAIKAARDQGKAERGITEPEMVLPITVHPAFEKAAHYFGVKAVHIPIDDVTCRADVKAAEAAITENTVLMAGSAPAYPHGVVDPITELAGIAKSRGINFHVDACLGGYLLPFVKDLGYDVPPWDFSVEGVTSISADLHKYGYAARGASTVLYRSPEYRKYQYFCYTDWPGGLYGSPSFAGSRPGGAIAAAWAVMKHLGRDGYTRLAKIIMDTSKALIDGIDAIEGLRVMAKPDMGVFAFTADGLDLYAIGEGMKAKGWELDPQQKPPALHLMVTPAHAAIVDDFLADLREVTETVRASGESAGGPVAALYGMAASMPEKGPVEDMIIELMQQLLPPRG